MGGWDLCLRFGAGDLVLGGRGSYKEGSVGI